MCVSVYSWHRVGVAFYSINRSKIDTLLVVLESTTTPPFISYDSTGAGNFDHRLLTFVVFVVSSTGPCMSSGIFCVPCCVTIADV